MSSTCSSARNLQLGVIQSSVIGSTFFNFFINDLHKVIHYIKLFTFAKDGKGLAEVFFWENTLFAQEDQDAISNWSVDNNLPLSVTKCCVLHFGSHNPMREYMFNGSLLIAVDDLGILRTKKFSYSKRVEKTVAKVSWLCGMFCVVFTSRSKEFKRHLWVSYLRPKLEYGCQVRQNSCRCYKLERIQRRFTKCMPTLNTLSYEDRLNELRLPSLHNSREFVNIIFLHKLFKGQLKIQLTVLLIRKVSSCTRSNSVDVTTRCPKTATIQRSFCFRIVSKWNNLLGDRMKCPWTKCSG